MWLVGRIHIKDNRKDDIEEKFPRIFPKEIIDGIPKI